MQQVPQPWGAPQPPWGQPQAPWGAPPAPIPPPKKKSHAWLFVVLAGLLLGTIAAVAGAGYYLYRRVAVARLDPAEIPAMIHEHVPCKKSCKVTNIGVHDTWFSVSVVGEPESRTLLYRVYPYGAELGFSQDWPGAFSPKTLDYRAIDWSLVDKLRKDLQREAINGRTVDDVYITPCESGRDVAQPARACLGAKVLTARGDLERKLDATTGELKSEH